MADDFPGDPERNYAVPPDNRFVGGPGLDENCHFGLRNPWRCSFDRTTGDFLIADVGQDTWEEVNFQPVSSSGGDNYGWSVLEGMAHCYNDDPPGICDDFLTGRLHPSDRPGPPRSRLFGNWRLPLPRARLSGPRRHRLLRRFLHGTHLGGDPAKQRAPGKARSCSLPGLPLALLAKTKQGNSSGR